MSLTDTTPIRSASSPVIESASMPRLPWSRATIVGWSGLALGTITTIVIVAVAVTLP